MVEFVWTISLGQLVSTAVLIGLVVVLYGLVLHKVSRYQGRLALMECEIHRLKIDIEMLMERIRMTDAGSC